ncbi:MAG: hypothetical protein U0984_04995 [Prosthecobacter sp.]|nr:hypothetical protein [Prosthecobacter sp.]
MVWKILSALCIICLGTASYFAWAYQSDIKAERLRGKNAESNLKAAQARKGELETGLKEKQAQLVTLQKDRDAVKEAAVKMATDAAEKEAALAIIKGNLEQVTVQVDSVEKQIKDSGDIEKLVAQVEKLKKDQLEAEGAVAHQIELGAQAKAELESVTKQIAALRDAEARGRRGIVDTAFNARVSQYFPEWDFAILSKGNAGGVFANADLEVKRGQNVIAKLKVRNVEQNRSIADLVPGSLATGNRIQAGDVVVAAANQSAAKPEPPTAPAADATATPTAPGAAPTAGAPGAAPAAPAMGGDPFGAPAAAPAAAPAMGGDPFGAPAAPKPGAPAAPAPAMSDPFGAPAAPATPPAGAPAAGTPAKPSTADPFAPAPAKP